MKKIYRIGVDLGGTNIATGLVDANDVVVDKLSCKTDLPRPAHDLEQAIAQQCRALAEKNGLSLEQISSGWALARPAVWIPPRAMWNSTPISAITSGN